MKKLLTSLVLLGMLLSLQVSFVGAQESDPPATPEPTTYVVQPGDTAESIAAMFGVSVEDLLAANGLSSPEEVVVDMTLVIPPAAQPTEEPTEVATEEPTEEPTEAATEEPTEEPTEAATEEPTEAATEEPTEVPTEAATEEPTAVPTEAATEVPTAVPTEAATEEPTAIPESEAASNDVSALAALPGTSTTKVIAVANLETSGSPEAPVLTLYDLTTGTPSTVSSIPAAYPGGVVFITDSLLPTGAYGGVLQSSFQAAAAALAVNSTAKAADAYPGFGSSAVAQTLYGPYIFNRHSTWESLLYCQNAESGTATINAALYKVGESTPKVTLSAQVDQNEVKMWDIADDATVQAAWPGGAGQFGYVVFSSPTNNIACVVDNQRMSSPYVQSQYNAVPDTYAGTDLRLPLVFNGHGTSSSNKRLLKWNSGVALINRNGGPANVSVTYRSGALTHVCTTQILAGGMANWYAPEMGTGTGSGIGWTCPSGAMPWSSPGPTLGAITVASDVPVLSIANGNRYDAKAKLGAGFSGLAGTAGNATYRAVCPMAFNKNRNTDWITGINVANVGTSGTTNVTVKMVRANVDPAGAGNNTTITLSNVAAGTMQNAYFPDIAGALTNFEGAAFVEATDPSAKIVANSSSTSYNTLSAAADYDCINY
jgi:outer membrane biosynthesis protein TonB